MKYIKRLIEILAIILKFLLKVLGVIVFGLLLCVHFLVFALSLIPIFLLQLLEWIIVIPIYYIVTGKKYYEKYNQLSDMAFDVIFLDRPYHIKSNKPKKDEVYNENDCDNSKLENFYICFWNKIMEINLKLKYD